jgi:Lysophospholipase
MRRLLALLITLSLAGCSFNPERKTQQLCPSCEIVRLATSTPTPVLGYLHNLGASADNPFLHVYLEGDGQPWLRGRWPATNPSSREMTALQLMQLDSNPSLYLNRPCYGYRQTPENCLSTLWTDGRYSAEVVATMAAALEEFGQKYPGKRLVLIGHSGGGTLVMLLAQRLENVAAVVTLAANLDHSAWTDTHGYLPLTRSLNPAEQPLLPESVIRWHLAGGKDLQVPAEIAEKVASRDPAARFILHPDFDHTCCWQQIWPELLQTLQHQLTGTK